jgi:integrase
LADEFVDNIKRNLSTCYYERAKDVVAKFQSFLEEIHLNKEPISAVRVRDIQMFLNSFQTYKAINNGNVKLKKDFPASVNLRSLAREKILDRCSSYELRRNRTSISIEKAQSICKFCNIDYNEYFYEINSVKPYATETIKGYRRVLRTIFNEAVRYEWITKNPVSQTKVGAGNGNTSLRSIQEKEVFSIQEAKDFIKEIDNIDKEHINIKIIFKFMILTGVRIAEMCGLRWSDIDFEKKIVEL